MIDIDRSISAPLKSNLLKGISQLKACSVLTALIRSSSAGKPNKWRGIGMRADDVPDPLGVNQNMPDLSG